ncbi:MAG: hypothetical protein PHY16_08795 [Methylobacter sp.]|nr:hypothetical protein [Methylobacter sp.]
MNTHLIKASTSSSAIAHAPFIKEIPGKQVIEIRQLVLIARIMMSFFTIGVIGYTLDRVRQSSATKIKQINSLANKIIQLLSELLAKLHASCTSETT